MYIIKVVLASEFSSAIPHYRNVFEMVILCKFWLRGGTIIIIIVFGNMFPYTVNAVIGIIR